MLDKFKKIIEKADLNISEEDFFNFLKIKYRWPYLYSWRQPSVEFIDFSGNNYKEDIYSIDGYLDFNNWLKKYNSGFTSIISNVLDLNNDLRNLHDKLYVETGKKINGNFYINIGSDKKPSFDHHNHSYDVIVRQLYGETTWKLNEDVITMKKDDILIIPKFANHSVIENNSKKLSLTINLD
jgi:mannose-6-phosphate isomerase-like protein (cupin superfamily)